MEPNNMGKAPVEANPVAPTAAPAETAPVTPAAPAAPVAPVPEQKKGHGAVIAAILFAVLAIGGIGFGVWTMMDGNTQKEQLNTQVDSLKKQNNELLDKVAELNEQIENSGSGTEEGYRIIEIGECVADQSFDGEDSEEGTTIIKCEATTSEGTGKFVYDSSTNSLTFVTAE